jgi:hypothetical protein
MTIPDWTLSQSVNVVTALIMMSVKKNIQNVLMGWMRGDRGNAIV